MTITEIIAMSRGLLDDEVVSYKVSTDEIIRFINNSQSEACRRGNLIIAYPSVVSITGSSNISFASTGKKITKATGGFLTATGLSEVNTFEINDEITISGTSLNNGVKTIVSVSDTEIVISETVTTEATTSAVITATRTITRIPLRADVHTYRLHPKLLNVIRVRPDSLLYPLKQKTLSSLDAESIEFNDPMGALYSSTWETLESNMFSYIEDNGSIRIISPPAENDILWMVASRLPKYEFTTSDTTATPEIPSIYHADLVDWVLHLAFKKPDSEIRDLDRAKEYELSFERKFGSRPSAQTESNRRRFPNNMEMRHRPLGF